MTAGADPGDLRRKLRAYYRPILPLWDRTLAERGDLPLWRWAAGRWSGRAALELGAGTGRVTEVLAGEVRPLVAVDLNPDALRGARRRLSGAGRAHLVLGDMRTLRLARRFDLVVAANDPFSHLRTDAGRDRALARVAEHLAPGGWFLLDALWFPEAFRRDAARPGGTTTERRTPGGEEGPPLVVRNTWRCEPDTGRCTARFECRREGEIVARSLFEGRCWTREELAGRLGRAGLRVDALWGDYGRGPWDPDASEHMVVRASLDPGRAGRAGGA
jgi:SAM-dependent methyltransferase